jgi:RNA polymerase sigma factor (sigma-70 family)
MMPLMPDSSDPAVPSPNEELLLRSLAGLRRWARGRLPSNTRNQMDTCDLVQETALNTLKRLASFTPEHAGSMPAYLQRAAGNIVIDAVRRARRRPVAPLNEAMPLRSTEDDALTVAIRGEARAHYRAALRALRAKDRRLLIARHHLEWSYEAIAKRLGLPSVDAVRMALRRAERRLHGQLACDSA